MLPPTRKDERLAMPKRRGIGTDGGPGCRGIWLDRGELDEVIQRSTRDAEPPRLSGHDRPHHPSPGGSEYTKHKRQSPTLWLKEIFD